MGRRLRALAHRWNDLFHVEPLHFARRWSTETFVWFGLCTLCSWCWLLGDIQYGPLVCGLVLCALCIGVGRIRYGLSSKLIARWRLRPTQKRIDLALRKDSPRFLTSRPSPIGTHVVANVNLGSNVQLLSRHSLTMAAALGVRDVRVRQRRENAAIADLLVVTSETLERVVSPERFLSQYRPDVFDCVPLGVDEDGNDVVIGLIGRHLLIGGEPGGGKSGTLSVVLAAAARDPNCELWCFDGKLVELAAWRPVATRVVGAYMAEAIEALDEIRAEMDRRYVRLLQSGERNVEKGGSERPMVVVIDELAFYVANGDKKQATLFAEKLRDLVARARAAGIAVVAATQKPSTDLVPSALRDNFALRLAHRCSTREASDTILGSGWATKEISASDIDPKLRGVGYLLAETGTPQRIRSMHLSDAAIRAVVEDAKRIRGIS